MTFIPWSGEILPDPIPAEPPPPSPPPLTPVPDLPPELPSTPFPPIGNPLKYIVHGAQAAWSDIASWVSDTWHAATSGYNGADIAIYDGVKKIVDQAVNASQTAWSTFASALETQLVDDMANVTATIDDLTQSMYANVNALWDGLDFVNAAITNWATDAFRALEHLLAGAVNDAVQRENVLSLNLQRWAIDNIYRPLQETIFETAQQIYAALQHEAFDLQSQLNQITAHDLPALAASVGALKVAVAALEQFNQECGEPMCEQYGPKTDFSKLVKLLNIAGMLALLTSIGTLTEAQLEQLAATVVQVGESGAEGFEQAFFQQGDTLAAAIASTLPAIGL